MKNEIRPFLKGWRNCDGYISNIKDQDEIDEIPEQEGVYIIASQEKKFIYPNGESPIIYIGKSDNLRKRLKEHHREVMNLDSLLKSELSDYWYYSRYQYINKFEGQVFFYTKRGKQTGKGMEEDVLGMFYNRFLSLPVGNGCFSFRS